MLFNMGKHARRQYVENIGKEVNEMPQFDKTGPMGRGAKTGWGAGSCQNNSELNQTNLRSGRGFGRGGNRGFQSRRSVNENFGSGMRVRARTRYANTFDVTSDQDQRSILESRKNTLQNQLSEIEQILQSFATKGTEE